MELQKEVFILRHGRINAAFSSTIGSRMHGHGSGKLKAIGVRWHVQEPIPDGTAKGRAYTAPRQNKHCLQQHNRVEDAWTCRGKIEVAGVRLSNPSIGCGAKESAYTASRQNNHRLLHRNQSRIYGHGIDRKTEVSGARGRRHTLSNRWTANEVIVL